MSQLGALVPHWADGAPGPSLLSPVTVSSRSFSQLRSGKAVPRALGLAVAAGLKAQTASPSLHDDAAARGLGVSGPTQPSGHPSAAPRCPAALAVIAWPRVPQACTEMSGSGALFASVTWDFLNQINFPSSTVWLL